MSDQKNADNDNFLHLDSGLADATIGADPLLISYQTQQEFQRILLQWIEDATGVSKDFIVPDRCRSNGKIVSITTHPKCYAHRLRPPSAFRPFFANFEVALSAIVHPTEREREGEKKKKKNSFNLLHIISAMANILHLSQRKIYFCNLTKQKFYSPQYILQSVTIYF